jgi:hypothetical protein
MSKEAQKVIKDIKVLLPKLVIKLKAIIDGQDDTILAQFLHDANEALDNAEDTLKSAYDYLKEYERIQGNHE